MMYQAIQTKYFGASNVKPARVKAIAEAGSITVSWDHALNADGNHKAVAEKLARKFGWRGEWFGGALPGNSGYAFVCTEDARNAAWVITHEEANKTQREMSEARKSASFDNPIPYSDDAFKASFKPIY